MVSFEKKQEFGSMFRLPCCHTGIVDYSPALGVRAPKIVSANVIPGFTTFKPELCHNRTFLGTSLDTPALQLSVSKYLLVMYSYGFDLIYITSFREPGNSEHSKQGPLS